MAGPIVQVAGLAVIEVNTAAGNGLEVLGYTQDGAEIEFEGKYIDVPGDENAGLEDLPVDVQFIGELAIIRLRLTKWDDLVGNKIRALTLGGTAGAPAAVGSLMFNGQLAYRLVINCPTNPYNFNRVVFRQPHSINKGNKYSTWNVQATAYKDANGVLYNAVVT